MSLCRTKYSYQLNLILKVLRNISRRQFNFKFLEITTVLLNPFWLPCWNNHLNGKKKSGYEYKLVHSLFLCHTLVIELTINFITWIEGFTELVLRGRKTRSSWNWLPLQRQNPLKKLKSELKVETNTCFNTRFSFSLINKAYLKLSNLSSPS